MLSKSLTITITCMAVLILSAGYGKVIKGDKIGPDQAEAGFLKIFNGRDLTGWEGDTRVWSVQNGAITGQIIKDKPLKSNTFLMWRGGKVSDFELCLSYRLEGGNSGIQFRSRELDNWDVAGYQADLDAGGTWTGYLYDEHGRRTLAARGQKVVIDENGKRQVTSIGDPAELFKYARPGVWNKYHIIARGNILTLKINGVVMSEVIDKEKGKADSSGILALQVHEGPPMKIQFKDIRLKKLANEDVGSRAN